MRVSHVISRLTDKVQEIIDALDNRLTAADNFGPEGEVGQVLTSRGPRPSDPPPSYQNLADILRGIPTTTLQGIPGLQGPPGVAGATGPSGPGGFVPTYIAPAETFVVPVDRQALYAVPVVVDGALIINGVLVGVD